MSACVVLLTGNQNVVADQVLTSSEEGEINSASATPTVGRLGDNYSSICNAASNSDLADARSATSYVHHNSFDENDIVIA